MAMQELDFRDGSRTRWVSPRSEADVAPDTAHRLPVDVVVVCLHVAAEGTIDGRLQRHEFVRSYKPRRLGERSWTAIAWTTSASACAVIELVSAGALPQRGFLRQESIPLAAFLETRAGALFESGAAG